MKLILSGAMGTMGRVVAANAPALGCEIVAGVDREASSALAFPVFAGFDACPADADAIVDFYHPAVLPSRRDFAGQPQIPAVIATTGMSDADIARIHEAAGRTPIFFSFNMSLGVNLLVALAQQATAVLGEGFDIEIIEKHHNKKIDAPSGTAVMLANAIAETTPYDPTFVYDRHSVRKRREPAEIGIHSVRGGTIVGEHEVIFAGMDEIITLSHSARSKGIFAIGALKAARFLTSVQPGLYDMKSMLQAATQEENV
ncbi:MAG: 4-hydroxy-tetrahydrodipicolinate reductase [Oscillospiraceae bacterium]